MKKVQRHAHNIKPGKRLMMQSALEILGVKLSKSIRSNHRSQTCPGRFGEIGRQGGGSFWGRMENELETMPYEIRKAYLCKMRKFHPDIAGENDQVRIIRAAYDFSMKQLRKRGFEA